MFLCGALGRSHAASIPNANPLTIQRLVFPAGADKVFDGTTSAAFNSFKPDINGIVPGGGGMTLAGGTANYASAGPGVDIPITFNGFTLGGTSAGFSLPVGCCGAVTRTTGTITAGAAPVPPIQVTPILPIPVTPDLPIQVTPVLPLLGLPLLAGLNFTNLGGITMPTFAVAEVPPAVREEVAPPPPPPAYVPPPFVPRQTRN